MSVSENIQLASEDEQRLGYRMKTLLDYLCMMIQCDLLVCDVTCCDSMVM